MHPRHRSIDRAVAAPPTAMALLLLCLLPAMLSAAELAPRNLLADGAPQALYLARVQPTDDSQPTLYTRVESRSLPGGTWTKLTELAGRATDLATREGQFVLLQESGDWWAGRALGTPLPRRRPMLLLAGGANALWAIGGPVPAGAATAPVTAPATEPSVADDDAVLFRLDKNTWRPIAPLPEELGADLSARNAALAAVNGQAIVARLRADGQIATGACAPDGQWTARSPITPPFAVYAMQLLDVGRRPVLWLASQSGPGVLYQGAQEWEHLQALKVDADLSQVTDRAVAVAAERIRLLFLRDGKLFEQQFDESGAPLGPVNEIVLPKPPDQRMLNGIQLAMMFALMLLLMGSVRRRPLPQKLLESTHLRIAPAWPRLLAGLIDALPYLVGMYLYASRVDDTAAHLAEPAAYPVWIGLGVYFLHITLSEIFRGQSVGKLVFGLRVVSLDGKKAGPGAILVRNLVLMIEVFLLFPLVLMFYSPLRQRIGDMTARTLVIVTARPDEPASAPDEP